VTFITVSQGGPGPDTDIPDGVYPVILTELKDPRTVTARRGPRAGQDIDLIDWVFTIDAPGTTVHEKPLDGSTSTASGPRSKMYAWLTALLGGRPPAPQQQFAKGDLIGRMALATVSHDEGGWPQIASLGAVPPSMLGQRVAAATGAPVAAPAAVAPPPAPAPALVGAATGNSDDLPF
jgi:hypothetical protein